MEGAGCLFSGTLAMGKTGASVGWYKNSLKNLLNFYFPGTEAGIDEQFRFEPA
jgi:hypothetical protein